MRMLIVLLLFGGLGFGTGVFGRMPSSAHVWPIRLTTPHLISMVPIVGANRTAGSLGVLAVN